MPNSSGAPRALPKSPNLENLKKQARTLLKNARAGANEAQARLLKHHPRLSQAGVFDGARLSLSAAQLVIAREYGFSSWPKLKAHVLEQAERADRTLILEEGAELPLIVLRDGVVCPHSVLDRGAHSELVAGAARAALGSDSGYALCVAQRTQSQLKPTRADLFDVAALVRIESVRGSKNAPAFRLHYQARARLTRFIASEDYPRAEAALLAEERLAPNETTEAVERLYERLELLARRIEWLSTPELARLRRASDLSGLIAAAAEHCDTPTKQALLEASGPGERVRRVREALEARLSEPAPVAIGGVPVQTRAEQAEVEACLVVLYAAGYPHLLGRRYALTEARTSLGRSESNHVLLHSHSVSRVHALIERCGLDFELVDQTSTNGSFVGDAVEPIERCILSDGDRIALGDVILRFLRGPDLEGKYREAVEYIAGHDALTRVLNEKSWLVETERQVFLARGNHRALSMVLLQIDQIQAVTERIGRLGGNALLLRVAEALRRELGEGAIIGRCADDRFAVTLPGCDEAQARERAERLQAEVSVRAVTLLGEPVEVTVSVGLATLYQTTGAEDLLADASSELERAPARAERVSDRRAAQPGLAPGL